MRTFSAYGPRLRKQVIYDFICKLRKKPESLKIYGDGSQTRDFIHVKDIVQAAMVIAERGEMRGEVYNVASGESRSILDLASKLMELMGVKPLLSFTGDVRAGEPEYWQVDIRKLKSLGYYPKKDFVDGVTQTINWVVASIE